MNKKQKIIFLLGVSTIMLMGVFPPWVSKSQMTYEDFEKFSKILKFGEKEEQLFPLSAFPIYREKVKFRLITRAPWPEIYGEPGPSGQMHEPYRISLFYLVGEWVVVGIITYALIQHYKER